MDDSNDHMPTHHDEDGDSGDEYINPEDVEYVEDEEEGGDVPMDEDDSDDEQRPPPDDNSLGHSGTSLR